MEIVREPPVNAKVLYYLSMVALVCILAVSPWIMLAGVFFVGEIVAWFASPHIEGERGSRSVAGR
jgi:hypothetical protein